MSEDILEVHTSFSDVAALGQGWTNRVDGERLILPFAGSVGLGDGVRFIVHLADGTPAFAGAGRCIDVADLGEDATEQARSETLVAALQFDERSKAVYDYLVAVRASLGVEGAVSLAALVPGARSSESDAGGGGLFAEALERQTHGGSAPPDEEGDRLEIPEARASQAGGGTGSLGRPSLIPTGMLMRPALGLEWEPAPPRDPMPTGSSGLFDYNGGGIPRPEHPPYPDLDRSLWVTPAPRPGAESAALHAGEAGAGYASDASLDAGGAEAMDDAESAPFEDASEEMLEDASEEVLEDASEEAFEDGAAEDASESESIEEDTDGDPYGDPDSDPWKD